MNERPMDPLWVEAAPLIKGCASEISRTWMERALSWDEVQEPSDVRAFVAAMQEDPLYLHEARHYGVRDIAASTIIGFYQKPLQRRLKGVPREYKWFTLALGAVAVVHHTENEETWNLRELLGVMRLALDGQAPQVVVMFEKFEVEAGRRLEALETRPDFD